MDVSKMVKPEARRRAYPVLERLYLKMLKDGFSKEEALMAYAGFLHEASLDCFLDVMTPEEAAEALKKIEDLNND